MKSSASSLRPVTAVSTGYTSLRLNMQRRSRKRLRTLVIRVLTSSMRTSESSGQERVAWKLKYTKSARARSQHTTRNMKDRYAPASRSATTWKSSGNSTLKTSPRTSQTIAAPRIASRGTCQMVRTLQSCKVCRGRKKTPARPSRRSVGTTRTSSMTWPSLSPRPLSTRITRC